MTPSILDLSIDEIDAIKPCWEKLNAVHREDSVYFKDHYANFTFEKRVAGLRSTAAENFKLTAVKAGDEVSGYCLSTIADGVGEIQSLYLGQELRGRSIGRELVALHKEWFKSRGCRKVIVTVSHGHDSVLGFYHKLGFYERLMELELKE
jgi:ribosomal protein S18 acetylase RimI-like enzyme